MDEQIREMVAEFRRQIPEYERFGEIVHEDLRAILDGRVDVWDINVRVKEPASLAEKLNRPGKQYPTLSAVTDLLGLRVITYFADDVDRVAALIDQEFDVDPVRSVDKRKLFHVDQFGYVAVHKICRLSAQRRSQPALAPYVGICFEIQIRSLLQSAWAEIEHDLGYKASHEDPHLKRRFSILASLLELADEEFMRLRDAFRQYT